MMKQSFLIIAVAAMLAMPISAEARRNDQGAGREDVQQGKVKTPREIVDMVKPKMRGMQYLTFEYYPSMLVYRLKFLDGERVRFVDVDARTGRIISMK
ncbi:MAG: hypothetical protein HC843_07705 [Sphingomonadales bacterium]|nr:hypothetical protein [Sphingomonadales bacterium]